MSLQVYWTVVTFLLCKATTILAQTPCDPEVRSTNMDDCLTQVKVDIMDKNKFWFGTQYSMDCPDGPVGMYCSNAHCNNTVCPEESIATRLFPNGLNLTLIDKYLEVHYVSERGSYTACGNTFEEESWQGEVTPNSSVVYRPWVLRNVPRMTWTASDDEYYTVIFYDVGYFVIHLVYVNVPGDDVMNGEIKRSYNGPKISIDQDNPYAFFLFKQEGRVTITQEWETKITSRTMGQFSIPDFAEAHNMTGPVAVNWVVATGDTYAAQYMEDMMIMYNCPVFVGKEMDLKRRPFLPYPARLSVGVYVNFVSGPIQYTACCENTALPREEFALNPFENELYNTALVRSENTLTFTFRKAGYYAASGNFSGDMYALITVDPDAPYDTAGTEARPILHMMVVNIVDGDLNTGDVVATYKGPNPRDLNAPHYYYFLLYKQEAEVNATMMPSYAGDSCSGSLQGRCLYDINTAVSEQTLTLVGANWMRAVSDDYVIVRRLNTSDPEAVNTTCFGRPLFEVPCPMPTSTGSVKFISYIILAVAATVVMVI